MGLRQMVPASSRSFWQLYGEVETIRDELRAMRKEVAALRQERAAYAQRLDKTLAALDMRHDLMLWEAMHREGESMQETKQRFFYDIPPAVGGMRLMQQGCAKLLGEFDQLCSENDIPYWIAFGTLLGSIRHGGSIPWDDDIDLGMMRNDIARLQSVIEGSDRYRITVKFDSDVQCRQVRFCVNDDTLPFFLDLFIFDYAPSADYSMFEHMKSVRKDMIAELHDKGFIVESPRKKNYFLWFGEKQFIDAQDSRCADIEAVFDAYVAHMHETVYSGASNNTLSPGIVWGIDNVDDFNNYDWCCSRDDIFPLQRMTFEHQECNGPANHMKFLEEVYGDIYALPSDIGQHLQHVSHAGLEEADLRRAMARYIEDDLA